MTAALETDSGSEDEEGNDYYLYVLDGDENDEVRLSAHGVVFVAFSFVF